MYLLKFDNKKMLCQKYLASQISPYIENNNGKKRLIEPPSEELKRIQRNLKNILLGINIPKNVFSGVKGRSYIDNSKFHLGNKYLFKMDLTGFFPSISRENVYKFFINNLKASADIAEILTNMTTVDLNMANTKFPEVINTFLAEKGITSYNHLISGAPTSQILSYLANINMFNEIQTVSDKSDIIFTIYVDDLTFSSENNISNAFKNQIFKIVSQYGYHVSSKKTKCYSRNYPKLVTGVIIKRNGTITLRNSLHAKIIHEFTKLRANPNNNRSRLRLNGLITAARQINPNAFPGIYMYLHQKK